MRADCGNGATQKAAEGGQVKVQSKAGTVSGHVVCGSSSTGDL